MFDILKLTAATPETRHPWGHIALVHLYQLQREKCRHRVGSAAARLPRTLWAQYTGFWVSLNKDWKPLNCKYFVNNFSYICHYNFQQKCVYFFIIYTRMYIKTNYLLSYIHLLGRSFPLFSLLAGITDLECKATGLLWKSFLPKI